MSNDLLTFELDKNNDQLFIHGDPTGLRRFAELLNHLADQAEKNDFPHDHLFSKEWGGDELSTESQEGNTRCLNHVKVYGWPDIRGSAPYEKNKEKNKLK